MVLQDRFHELLVRAAAELYQDNRHRMDRPDLIPTPNVIDSNDLELLFEGLERGLISLERGGKFNTLDRPVSDGHWSLLSRRPHGRWYNAEYLPQLAAYVELIRRLGYPADRVLFELPLHSLQLDLAVITDAATVVVLGEAKRAAGMLDSLAYAVRQRFSQGPPGEETKRRGDEARQLAWRLWRTRTTYLWLVGPGVRHAYHCSYNPLTLHSIPSLPTASTLGWHSRRRPRSDRRRWSDGQCQRRATGARQPNGGSGRSWPEGCVKSDVAYGLPVRVHGSVWWHPAAWLGRPIWMLSKLAYLTLCRSIQLLVLLARGDAAKDMEILMLRHQLKVLRRQTPRPKLEP